MKHKLLIPVLVVAAAAFFWAVGPSVSLSFLLRSPIVLFHELVSLMWPASAVDSTGPNASIFTLRRPQLLLESAAMNPGGTGGARVAPTTGSTRVPSPTSVLSPPSVLNPPSPNLLPSGIINNPVPTNPLPSPIGTLPDLLPTITAPSVPSVPSVTVPDVPLPSVTVPSVPSVPTVTVPSVPSVPSVTAPSVPSTPSVSVPSAPTPSPPSGGAPPAGGGSPPGGGGSPPGGGLGGIGIKLP